MHKVEDLLYYFIKKRYIIFEDKELGMFCQKILYIFFSEIRFKKYSLQKISPSQKRGAWEIIAQLIQS